MEISPASRLPEADFLPDGFVESSADPSPPLPPDAVADYKIPLLDVDSAEDRGQLVEARKRILGLQVSDENESCKLEEQKDECLNQLKENEMLRNKLELLFDQLALLEQQFAEEGMLKLELPDQKVQCQQEESSHEQTQMEHDFEQDAFLKCNGDFELSKQEIEKMAILIEELKKENAFLKSKCKNSDIIIAQLVEERDTLKEESDKVRAQIVELEAFYCTIQQAGRRQEGSKLQG